MPKLLIHIHTGPENPTKAALGFLVAATALKEGHSVDLFLAGDRVILLHPEASLKLVLRRITEIIDALRIAWMPDRGAATTQRSTIDGPGAPLAAAFRDL